MKYLIIGGTGTLGKAFIQNISQCHNDIHVISREELKQKNMREDYPFVKFHLSNVQDKDDIARIVDMVRPDYIFNFAALKHVDIAEENPLEAIKTNLIGALNVADVAMRSPFVKRCVFSSTDKAVLPINVYGMSKGAAELSMLRFNKQLGRDLFAVFRWGNVLGSRGSVIHKFYKDLKEIRTAYITHEEMTRFWIHIDDAAKFLADNFKDCPGDRVMVPHMKASKLITVIEAVAEMLELDNYRVETIGIRDGEKIHECLYSSHDKCIRSDTALKFTYPEILAMVKEVLS